jgi:hypothetical protein
MIATRVFTRFRPDLSRVISTLPIYVPHAVSRSSNNLSRESIGSTRWRDPIEFKFVHSIHIIAPLVVQRLQGAVSIPDIREVDGGYSVVVEGPLQSN